MSVYSRILAAALVLTSTRLLAAPHGPPAPPPAPATSAPPATQPATQPSAAAFVGRVVGEAMRTLGDNHLPAPEKRGRIRDLALQALDFDVLARLSMGHYWRSLSEQQRRDFTGAFRQHLINTCCDMTAGFTDERLTVLGEREETHGDRTVRASVGGKDDNGNKVEYAKVEFRTRQRDGQWRVIDVSTSGVSLLVAFKVQFESLMAVGGYDRVMKMLHDKNAAATTAAAAAATRGAAK